MIIMDFSLSLHQNVHILDKLGEEINKENLRIRLLDSILYVSKRFKEDYGNEIIIALDNSSWRKSFFSNYKSKRKEKRKEDKFDWDSIHKYFNEIIEEIKENLPYKVIKVYGAEGDDIVAVLANYFKNTSNYTLIVGPDKDYAQLHRLPNVKQYCPIKNQFLNFENDEIMRILFTHICRGDSSDGIPSILNDKDCFVNGIRQKPLKQVYINEAFEHALKGGLKEFLGSEKFKRFEENKTLIDFRSIPEDLKEKIISGYEKQKHVKNNIYKYIVQNDLVDKFLKEIQHF